MRIGELDFFGVKVENRDFQGKKFGPDYKTFAVEITDEQVKNTLQTQGVNLWFTTPRNDDPSRCKMNVRVDDRFGDVDIVLVDADDRAVKLNPNNPLDMKLMDEAWIDGADMHIVISKYNDNRGNEHVTPYLQTLVARKLSQQQIDEIREANANRRNPVRERWGKYFG